MGYNSLQMQPGVNVEKTPLLNSASWSYSIAVRFRDGLPEKCGGFNALNTVPLIGICTGMHAWADMASNAYIACGTDQRLELYFGGTLFDITPLRDTADVAVSFYTVINTPDVKIHDVAHGASAGDWVDVVVPVSIGGLIIQGFYLVQTVADADNYTITAASNATGTVSAGGAVPVFDSTMTSGDVQVTLANHGLALGSTFDVQVSTTVGGLVTGVNTYSVVGPVTTNTFVIQPGGTAASSATISENGGDARLAYLIPSGLRSSTPESGYGIGVWGAGVWGISSSGTIIVPLRLWFLDNFGGDLVASYGGSPLYLWLPPVAVGNVALELNPTNFPGADNPPTQVNVSFVAAPQQMIIVLGCDGALGEDFNPLRVRWCNESDYLTWIASPTNTAGSYTIPSGSRLVSGISAPNFIVIWTDIDMWLMNYLGGTGEAELVWGFNKVAVASDLLAPNACTVYRNLVFFLSSNRLYSFNGSSIDPIPCPVWDKLWKNLDRTQQAKVSLGSNSYFQELYIFYPSLTGGGVVDSRLTYNMRENSWTFDDAPTLFARTAWTDENVYGAPIGTDESGYLQQQDVEGVYDANGVALPASIRTGWFSTREGSILSMLERLESDLIVTGGNGQIFVTVYTQNYATGPLTTYGPYAWIVGQGPPFSIVRARGRFFSIEISSTAMGVFWRQGDIRLKTQQAGRRP